MTRTRGRWIPKLEKHAELEQVNDHEKPLQFELLLRVEPNIYCIAGKLWGFFCGTGMKAWCSDHTPNRWWPCSIYTCNQRNDIGQWSKASLCNNGLLFLLCGGLRKYESIKTMLARTKNWLVEQKDSALLISTSTTCEHLLRVHWYFVYIVAGWVCFAANIYRADTIFMADCREPSHSHGYQLISMYNVMTSSIHLGSFIFSRFIFSRKQICQWKSQKFAPSENFPLYGI